MMFIRKDRGQSPVLHCIKGDDRLSAGEGINAHQHGSPSSPFGGCECKKIA